MAFGTRAADEVQRDDSTRWIKNLKKGETRIRFLQEHEEWYAYYEHYDPSLGPNGRSFPCTRDRNTCPGCTSDQERVRRASKRYLVNALVDGYVDLYKIPASLMSKVIRRSDADEGTLLKRDFTITKAGSGLETEYDMEREEKAVIDLDQYAEKFQDFEEALQSQYSEAFGAPPEDADDNQDPQPPKKTTVKRTEAAKTVERAKAKAKEPVAEVPPTEPQENPEGDEVELSEDEVRKMSAPELLALFQQCGIAAPGTNDTKELADALIKALS